MTTQLALPPHYKRDNALDPAFRVASNAFGPGSPRSLMEQAEEWAKVHSIDSPVNDKKKIGVLGIDWQFDFGFAEGALYVAGQSGKGAMEDARRFAEFIYRNLGIISSISLTQDSHHPWQVFYPSAHVLNDGSHPPTFSVVTADDYKSGRIQANPAMASALRVSPTWLTHQFQYYCEQLEKSGRYALTLWPEHCMLGSHGHQLAGIIDEMRYFYSYARRTTAEIEVKGLSQLTENYSVFQPEVMTRFDGKPIPFVQKNTKLIKLLAEESDMVVIGGEAMSHCLAWSVQDLITEIFAIDPTLAGKVYVMRDCTSPVVVSAPDGTVIADHTNDALAAFAEFENRGAHIVNSTDPIESWPGIAEQVVVGV